MLKDVRQKWGWDANSVFANSKECKKNMQVIPHFKITNSMIENKIQSLNSYQLFKILLNNINFY